MASEWCMPVVHDAGHWMYSGVIERNTALEPIPGGMAVCYWDAVLFLVAWMSFYSRLLANFFSMHK